MNLRLRGPHLAKTILAAVSAGAAVLGLASCSNSSGEATLEQDPVAVVAATASADSSSSGLGPESGPRHDQGRGDRPAAGQRASCVVGGRTGEFAPDESAQAAKRKVIREVLTPRFGIPRKGADGVSNQLSQGYIGLAIDRDIGEYIAVVDATTVDVAQLDAELKRAAAAAADKGTPVRFRAQGSCFSTAELQNAAQVLRERDWHPRARAAVKTWHLEAADSTYHIEVNDPEVADSLQKVLGDRVTFAAD